MKILAYTITHGDRQHLKDTVPAIRAAAGCWFDWAIWMGKPSDELRQQGYDLVNDARKVGIQELIIYPENRGQHHATNEALEMAKSQGYDWLLRLDDDISPKTLRFLTKMVERANELKSLAGDSVFRFAFAPRIVGLERPLQPTGVIEKGQPFPAEIMELIGGACRLHSTEFISEYKAPIYAPVGRQDPQSIAEYYEKKQGAMVRFPDIRVVHRTKELESQDTEEQKRIRDMGKLWPWLGPGV